MLKTLILIGVCLLISTDIISCSQDDPNLEDFMSWTVKYERKYETLEELKMKFSIFLANYLHVKELNVQHEGRTKFELNKFADMSTNEFKSKILMRSQMKQSKTPASNLFDSMNTVKDLPVSFDWREKGAVTPVKNQGNVGSCWAFSATQNLEGQYFLNGNKMTNLSVEQVVDCNGFKSKDDDRSCCGVYGGWPFLVFDYIRSAGGIVPENDYSYCSGTEPPCFPCGPPGYNATRCGPAIPYCLLKDSCQAKLDPTKFVPNLKIDTWKQTSENETEIATNLMEVGPLSVALDATMLQFYGKGVFDPLLGCSKTHLNHAVLMVGWGIEKSKYFEDKPYWLVKNSWGEAWGESGYFKILRNKGMCGINTQVTTAVLS